MDKNKSEKDKDLNLDPQKRVWEYEGDGSKIYKPEAGNSWKVIYTDKEDNE